MARKPRIEYEGAVYHVMNRGDRGGGIFKDRLDYELFTMTMGEVCRRTGWRVHAYVLMPNHFHWLIETPEADLVRHWEQVRYGWYAGSREFGEKLLEKLSSAVEGKQRTSYSGEAMREHDEHEAERLIRKGMASLEIDEDDLARLPKGHELKALLAWVAHKQTMASLAWLSNRLQMGFPTALSAYIRRIDVAQSGSVSRLKKHLQKVIL